MSKALTPKEIMKKRVRNNKLLKIPQAESEITKRNVISVNIKKYEKHAIDIKDDGYPNPFALTNRMRLFTKENPPRKVQPLPDFIDDVHTVCDIHKDFYKVVEARPLRQFDDIKVYMRNIRDLVDYRTNIGFIKDEKEKIDHNLREESAKYENILKLCNTCRHNYGNYLKQSFIHAKKIQEEAERVAIELENMTDQLEEYSFEYVRLRNGLGSVMGNHEKLLKYKIFLTSLAPAKWQEQYGEQNDNRLAKICEKLSSNLDITLKPPAVDSDQSLPMKYVKPAIYFRRPRQLMRIYETMARQGQHYLAIVNKTSGDLSSVRKIQERFRTTVLLSCAEMQDDIDLYNHKVQYLKERENRFKTVFYKILFNDFKELYADYENIKLHTCVQYVYTTIFDEPEDIRDKTMTLMRRLEGLYMNLSSKLDFLDVATVNAATKKFFEQDIKMMNNAHKAHRQLQQCDILRKALYTSFESPRNKNRKCRI